MRARDRIRLLFAPYQPPPLRVGDRAFCLVRDCEVVITGWSDGRIQWPRCRALHSRGGGSGLLVNETLAFAIRHESAAAIKHWWGVGLKAVWHWRMALGVGRTDSEGTRRLNLAKSKLGARIMKLYGVPDRDCDKQSERSKRLNLIRFAQRVPPRPLWSKEDLQALGEVRDEVLAARTGRTASAVRVMRSKLHIPTLHDRRRRNGP